MNMLQGKYHSACGTHRCGLVGLMLGVVLGLGGLMSVGAAQAACPNAQATTGMLTIDSTTGAVVVGGEHVACANSTTTTHVPQAVALDPDPEERTVLISRDSVGQPFPAGSTDFALSTDGRYGVFETQGSEVTDIQVYLRDLERGTTKLVSANAAGEPGNSVSRDPRISATGRYVVFRSPADNLVPNDTNNTNDIFLYDRDQDQLELISVASDGTQANGVFTIDPVVSADGRYVAFGSDADNLVPDDTNDRFNIFLRDRAAGTTTLISRSLDGTPVGGNVPSISADGRYIAYVTSSAGVVENDTNGLLDAFVYDRVRETTERVSIATDGSQVELPPGGSRITVFGASLSPDGRYVAFSSTAANLVANDTNGQTDVFVRDRVRGTTERVSVADDGSEGNDASSYASLSLGGRYVAFRSAASNLVANDTNGVSDVFVRDVVRGTTERVSVATDGNQSNADSGPITRTESSFFFGFNGPDIDGSGQSVMFNSAASNLVVDDTNGQSDVFVRTWR